MTVSTSANRADYTGNGTTTSFAVPFYFLDPTHLQVLSTVIATGVSTTLVLNSDYTVTGAGVSAGGTVTTTIAVANGNKLSVLLNMPFVQATHYVPNDPFPAASHEAALDYLTLLAKQTAEIASRSVQVPQGESGTAVVLPPSGTRAGYLLGFDGNGVLALVAAAAQSASALALSLLSSAGSSLVSFLQAGAGAIARTVQAEMREKVSAKQFGAAVDGVTNDATALANANAQAASVGARLTLQGVHHIGSAVTITVPIVDTMAQIFSTTSQVTINNGLPVRPEWFGLATAGAGDRAIATLPAAGGVVKLEDARYENLFQHAYNGAYMSKDNVLIKGTKMPQLTSDMKALVGGTIASGGAVIYANNVEIRDVGFDCGFTWCNAYNAGSARDGLSCTYASDALKNASAIRNGLRLHNIIGLVYGPASLNHGVILAEGYENVRATGEIVGAFGVHGIAIKAQGVRCQQLTAYCNNFDGVIIKTDIQATAIATDIQIDSVEVRATGPVGLAPYAVGGATGAVGLYFLAGGGTVDKVQISNVESYGYPIGIGTNFSGAYQISDISIGSAIVDQQGVAAGTGVGVQVLAPAGEVHRIRFGSITSRNTNVGLQAIFNQGTNVSDHLHVDRLEVVNASGALDIAATSYVSIGTVIAENCTGSVYHITGTPKLIVGMLFKDTLTTTVYSTASGGIAPSLANGWTQVASNDPFGIDLTGGRVNLRGLIKPGTTSTFSVLPQWAWPGTTKRTLAQGYNGTTQVMVPISVTSSGSIGVNEVAGGFANCSTWLSLTGVSWDAQA